MRAFSLAPRFASPRVWWASGAFACVALAVLLSNLAIERFFPFGERFNGDFTTTYLRLTLQKLAAAPPQTIFLGDGLLAGYGLSPQDTAVALLVRDGCACRNFAYKHGSPVSYYALALLLRAYGVRPKSVVLEINQAQFNPAYYGYRRLPQPVAELAWPLLRPADRAALPPPKGGLRQRFDRLAARVSLLVAMRTDLHQALLAGRDPKPPALDAGLKRAVYADGPLDDSNASVRYLDAALDVFGAMGTPVVAFAAPTNHEAFAGAIDARDYAARAEFLRRRLQRRGIALIDLDRAAGPSEFADEVHLNAAGQRKLASALAPRVGVATLGSI